MPKKDFGINKRLRDRRLELDYSELEACIRLDISKTKLRLIENGYITVNPMLQDRFIRKYKLEEDFFKKDNDGYISIIEPAPQPKKITKLHKVFVSIWFKIVSLALMGGFIAMGVIGFNNFQKTTTDTRGFFSNEIVNIYDYAQTNGAHHSLVGDELPAPNLLLDSYSSIEKESVLSQVSGGVYYESINFFSLSS